ncbi:hypothetical protein GCM10027049_30320 [Mucilaginibacter puniceus]
MCAQVIKGTVTDAATGKPIEQVNVYLAGTVVGTTTDSQGNFTLNMVTKTSAPILVSYVGYQTKKIDDYTDSKPINIALKRNVIALNEVKVTSDKISRARAMRIFLREFIGRNNSECEITNPQDIYFSYKKSEDLLTAAAEKPLIIMNKKLGYKVTYFLADFSYKPYLTSYKGNYFFEEDTAGLKPEKRIKMLKARNEAYKGSRMHFIRALWANELDKQGFAMYRSIKAAINTITPYDLDPKTRLFYDDIVQLSEGKKFILFQKGINPKDARFDNNEVYVTYQKFNPAFLRQTDSGNGTIIERTGYHDEGLQWKDNFGKWRVGELLPYEFEPLEDIE